ncbi:hypothetical protein R3P38DRAFT_2798691 [Favolaschia claudopus]|uniref:Uncharacterized protein n=1 Tax=Favolaschia claudopus TaxID=2862362 RepID=A0AAW0A0V0_9AGAR
MASLSSSDAEPIPALPLSALDSTGNPHQISLDINFDSMFAEEEAEKASEQAAVPHTMFAKINDAGHLTHKKSIVRELFDMTHDNHSSHDRLHRIRGYTIGGKSWNREAVDGLEQASLATHFSLGNIFSTVICYNQTHLGIAIGKSFPPPLKYTISGQIFSLVPIANNASKWAWTGEFVSFSVKKRTAATGDIAHLKNLQLNPDIDRGHRKLKLSGALGIDHINPASWLGDVVVGNVNIPQEWDLGRKDADAVLEKYFHGSIAVNWTVDPVDPTASSLSAEQVNHTLSETNQGPPQTAESYGLDLDNYFPENLDDLDNDKIPDIFEKFLIDTEGKKYLKSTLIAGLASNRSTLRTQRVQGLAVADFHQKRLDFDFDPLEEEDMVKIDDLVGILIQTKELEICLCALLVKEFKKENQTAPLLTIQLYLTVISSQETLVERRNIATSQKHPAGLPFLIQTLPKARLSTLLALHMLTASLVRLVDDVGTIKGALFLKVDFV